MKLPAFAVEFDQVKRLTDVRIFPSKPLCHTEGRIPIVDDFLPEADGAFIGRQWIGNAFPVIIESIFKAGEISPVLALRGFCAKRKKKKKEREKEILFRGCIQWVISRVFVHFPMPGTIALIVTSRM